ncbi:MAG: MarR family transcriptional regulator [Eubacteriales bacterium]|nr:MarR family transcriptional regulator [Eubacteriales bacterium]
MADKYDALKLENQLCFPLYACSREITRVYTPYLDKLGLTYTQYITMMVLWEHPTISVRDMGELLHLGSGTLTPLLKKMEQRGLLTRARSTEDERIVNITVTEEGMALREKALDVPQHVGSCINISPEEAGQLYSVLYKILDKIGEGE